MGIDVKQRKKQYCGSERAELLVAYRHSGLSQKEWCLSHDVALSTLGKWLKLEKEQVVKNEIANSGVAQVWVPVATQVMVSAPPPVREETILFKAGKFSITVGKNTDIKLLSEVLSVLVTLC